MRQDSIQIGFAESKGKCDGSTGISVICCYYFLRSLRHYILVSNFVAIEINTKCEGVVENDPSNKVCCVNCDVTILSEREGLSVVYLLASSRFSGHKRIACGYCGLAHLKEVNTLAAFPSTAARIVEVHPLVLQAHVRGSAVREASEDDTIHVSSVAVHAGRYCSGICKIKLSREGEKERC